jgi:hypothetical protein
MEAGLSVAGGAGGIMGFSSTVGVEVEATAFDSKPAEGAEEGVSTSGGLFVSRAGGASAVGFASTAVAFRVCSGEIIRVQGGSKRHAKGNKVKRRSLQLNESSY